MLRGISAALGAAATLVGGHRAYKAESLPWQEEGGQVPVKPDYAWLLERAGKGLAAEQGGTTEAQAKVLLLAYPRTGSSLLGELLSAAPSTSYFMEPLFGLLPVGQLDWDYALESRLENGEVPGEAVAALMGGIYSCDERVLDRLLTWSEAPHTSVTAVPLVNCRAGTAILSKTVRLHGAQVRQVAGRVEDLRVVHLVRDPRAVAASLQAQAEEWGGRSTSTYCRQLLDDLQVGEELGPDRYLRVAYEELVEKPLEVLDRIAAFTGIPVSDEVQEAVAVRMLGKAEAKQVADGNATAATATTEYYSTVRPLGHRHDRWRSKLGEEEVAALQCGPCGEVLARLGYTKVVDPAQG